MLCAKFNWERRRYTYQFSIALWLFSTPATAANSRRCTVCTGWHHYRTPYSAECTFPLAAQGNPSSEDTGKDNTDWDKSFSLWLKWSSWIVVLARLAWLSIQSFMSDLSVFACAWLQLIYRSLWGSLEAWLHWRCTLRSHDSGSGADTLLDACSQCIEG